MTTHTDTLLSEIRAGVPANDVAATYAAALAAERVGAERPDWARIHTAIARAWQIGGLSAIRCRAQLIIDGLIRPRRTAVGREVIDFRSSLP